MYGTLPVQGGVPYTRTIWQNERICKFPREEDNMLSRMVSIEDVRIVLMRLSPSWDVSGIFIVCEIQCSLYRYFLIITQSPARYPQCGQCGFMRLSSDFVLCCHVREFVTVHIVPLHELMPAENSSSTPSKSTATLWPFWSCNCQSNVPIGYGVNGRMTHNSI